MNNYPLEIDKDSINIVNYIINTRVNGPGTRFAIWVQGCPFRCEGCYNPHTHTANHHTVMKISDLVDLILDNIDSIDGLSFSGGEPFWQYDKLAELCRQVEERLLLSDKEFTFMSFTGLYLEEIQNEPKYQVFLKYLHYLKCGRYDNSLSTQGTGATVTSSNQTLYNFRGAPYKTWNTDIAEFNLDTDGNITQTGYLGLVI
jgi:anaerobic ribonucleoside-triphosphate reductase activating protein